MVCVNQEEVKLLDNGFVRLDSYNGDDLSVVNAARVSFATRRTEMDDKDVGLIKFLMKNRHGTPFEHNMFRFHVKCPIFVAREWFRHRIGSFNEWSGRYSQLEPDFYVPAAPQVRSQVGKPGSYTFEPVFEEQAQRVQRELQMCYNSCYELYERLLGQGIAKEVSRLVLPVAIYTQFYWTVNARSLMNFLSLRTAEAAMWEIRQYALTIEQRFNEVMPVTAAAFMENGKVSP